MSYMRYESPKKSGKGKGNKGFYMALGICLIAVGAAAFLTYQNVSQYLSPEQTISSENSSSDLQAGNTVSGIKETVSAPASSSEAPVASSQPASSSEPAASSSTADEPLETAAQNTNQDSIVYPVGSNITKEFSGENPVYSITFNDWRVHEGTDFSAEKGETVKAFTGGTVKEIYDDPMYGKTMVITHNGGYEAYYCGLGDTTLAAAGDAVYPGQEIGSVKDVPCETLEQQHLHLGIKKDGQWVNPAEVLAGTAAQ